MFLFCEMRTVMPCIMFFRYLFKKYAYALMFSCLRGGQGRNESIEIIYIRKIALIIL